MFMTSTVPLVIRFNAPVLTRLRQTARQRTSTPSSLASQLVDEGLRTLEFTNVVFRDGPSGRRAGIVDGPNVWEVIAALKALPQNGSEAVQVVAAEFSITAEKVSDALAYYDSYPNEIDQQIAENETAAVRAYESWLNQQKVLA